MDRILVITNYRTGSTNFVHAMAERHKLPMYGEICLPKWRVGNEGTEQGKIKKLAQGAKGVYKIMPDQIKNSKLADWIAVSDKIYYLYRRDFNAQVRSWIGVTQSGSWRKNGFVNGKTPHTGEYGKTEEFKVKVLPTNVKSCVNRLRKNYLSMAKSYKTSPGELVAYEDFYKDENYKPYNKKYNFFGHRGELQIPDLDIEALFNE